MRWIRIRKAKISTDLRNTLEQLGINVVQQIVASHDYNDWKFELEKTKVGALRDRDSAINTIINFKKELPILDWLTEQYDRAERKETWSITMEGAITVFVLSELILSICKHR